jgi:PIN domain nuclease of toxin-antitoxin system
VTTHLLDTNAWIRLVLAPEELSERTRSMLAQPGITPFALSAISIFEVTLKVRKGKIDLRIPADQ